MTPRRLLNFSSFAVLPEEDVVDDFLLHMVFDIQPLLSQL